MILKTESVPDAGNLYYIMWINTIAIRMAKTLNPLL